MIRLPGYRRRNLLRTLGRASPSFADFMGWDAIDTELRAQAHRMPHSALSRFEKIGSVADIAILWAVFHTASDWVTSGRNHIYRGTLSGNGMNYLAVAHRALAILQEAGEIDEAERRERQDMIRAEVMIAG